MRNNKKPDLLQVLSFNMPRKKAKLEDITYSYKMTPPEKILTNATKASVLTTDFGCCQIIRKGNFALGFHCGHHPVTSSPDKILKTTGSTLLIDPNGPPLTKTKLVGKKKVKEMEVFETLKNPEEPTEVENRKMQTFSTAEFWESTAKVVDSKILKGVTSCVFFSSHEHIDHGNDIHLYFAGKKMAAFILGGSPASYKKNEVLLEFIRKSIALNPLCEVYFTIMNENVASYFKTEEALALFLETHCTLRGIPVSGKKFIKVIDTLSSKNKEIVYSKFLDFGGINITLLNVNNYAKIFKGIYTIGTDPNNNCFIVRATIGRHSIVFTGDATVNAQQYHEIQSDAVVLAHGSTFSTNQEDILTIGNSPWTIKNWGAKIWMLPTAVSQHSPSVDLVIFLKNVICNVKKHVTLAEHEILIFFRTEDQDFEIARLKQNGFKVNLYGAVSKGDYYSEYSWCTAVTDLPILSLKRDVTIHYTDDKCEFFQRYTNIHTS